MREWEWAKPALPKQEISVQMVQWEEWRRITIGADQYEYGWEWEWKWAWES